MAWHDAAQRSVRSRAAAEVTSVDLLTRYPAATLPTVPRVPSSSTASISTTRPIRHPLKHEQAIVKLRRELIPLQQLEATKGRLLTMAETKKVGAIPDLIDEIEQLENDSRAWFEDDTEFNARCDTVANAAVKLVQKSQKAAAKKKGGSGGGGGWKTAR
mmetsp:Transcript_68405/g.190114  ORF Transcript_68405/g.190114 Transcript_68405/m.190114 type:complete len:159 (-) Transcript_68405:728-1204(-)